MVKPKKTKPEEKISKKEEEELELAEEELKKIQLALNGSQQEKRNISIKASKPLEKVKKGDKIKIDSLNLDVDAHYVLMDHGQTKEMALELFDAKTDKDYQLRYFSDQIEETLELYELQEIIYVKKPFSRIEW